MKINTRILIAIPIVLIIGGLILKVINNRAEKPPTFESYSEERQMFSINAYNYITMINKKVSEDDKLSIINTTWEVAKENNRDPYLYLAISRRESGFRPKVIGSHKEVGVWQIKIRTAQKTSPGVITNAKMKEMLCKIYFNITIGADHLEDCISAFDGNTIKGLMAYNCGRSAVKKKKVPDSTYKYVSLIMVSYYELRKGK